MRRGDIYHVDLERTKGSEQRGRRYVIIVSPEALNRHFPPIVCPITTGGALAREKGFTVSLQGSGRVADGVVLCHQVRTLDLSARGAKRVERAPEYIVDEVMAALQDIFADEE